MGKISKYEDIMLEGYKDKPCYVETILNLFKTI